MMEVIQPDRCAGIFSYGQEINASTATCAPCLDLNAGKSLMRGFRV